MWWWHCITATIIWSREFPAQKFFPYQGCWKLRQKLWRSIFKHKFKSCVTLAGLSPMIIFGDGNSRRSLSWDCEKDLQFLYSPVFLNWSLRTSTACLLSRLFICEWRMFIVRNQRFDWLVLVGWEMFREQILSERLAVVRVEKSREYIVYLTLSFL